jgi:hypothetical protein
MLLQVCAVGDNRQWLRKVLCEVHNLQVLSLLALLVQRYKYWITGNGSVRSSVRCTISRYSVYLLY